ncbi:hypothetical protein P692DRAFT_20881749 [Suillus brevipes Sb2]|nr:hypothetical protein P692DRAFT_20881749 [Suillus brevipes Sb2]
MSEALAIDAQSLRRTQSTGDIHPTPRARLSTSHHRSEQDGRNFNVTSSPIAEGTAEEKIRLLVPRQISTPFLELLTNSMDPVGDTPPTALYTSYTGPVAAYTDSIGADTSNDGHTPTMESAHTLQSTRFPIDELLLPPTPPT